jgi:chromate transporter
VEPQDQGHHIEAPVPGMSMMGMLGIFLKLGAIGFGGGMAVIAMMENEFVTRRRQFTADEFLHGVGMAQILGPFAPNAAFFLGYRKYGLAGALLSVLAFLLPSISIVILLSFLYFRYHSIPALQSVLAGLGPVVIALVLSAAWSMGRSAVKGRVAVMFALVGIAAGAFRINPAWVLLAAGTVGLLMGKERISPASGSAKPPQKPKQATGNETLLSVATPVIGAAALISLPALAIAFFKVGMVFFGGGFVLIPILYQKLVEEYHWLSPSQFVDGVAISNLTPGPIAVLATFTGFHMGGVAGAIVATAAIFTPAIMLMTVISAGYDRFKDSSRAKDFLAGVTPTVVGLVASAALLLWPSSIASWRAAALMIVALALLVRFKWHPAFVLAVGAGLAALGIVP